MADGQCAWGLGKRRACSYPATKHVAAGRKRAASSFAWERGGEARVAVGGQIPHLVRDECRGRTRVVSSSTLHTPKLRPNIQSPSNAVILRRAHHSAASSTTSFRRPASGSASSLRSIGWYYSHLLKKFFCLTTSQDMPKHIDNTTLRLQQWAEDRSCPSPRTDTPHRATS